MRLCFVDIAWPDTKPYPAVTNNKDRWRRKLRGQEGETGGGGGGEQGERSQGKGEREWKEERERCESNFDNKWPAEDPPAAVGKREPEYYHLKVSPGSWKVPSTPGGGCFFYKDPAEESTSLREQKQQAPGSYGRIHRAQNKSLWNGMKAR